MEDPMVELLKEVLILEALKEALMEDRMEDQKVEK
jgi:hypothetical protein